MWSLIVHATQSISNRTPLPPHFVHSDEQTREKENCLSNRFSYFVPICPTPLILSVGVRVCLDCPSSTPQNTFSLSFSVFCSLFPYSLSIYANYWIILTIYLDTSPNVGLKQTCAIPSDCVYEHSRDQIRRMWLLEMLSLRILIQTIVL